MGIPLPTEGLWPPKNPPASKEVEGLHGRSPIWLDGSKRLVWLDDADEVAVSWGSWDWSELGFKTSRVLVSARLGCTAVLAAGATVRTVLLRLWLSQKGQTLTAGEGPNEDLNGVPLSLSIPTSLAGSYLASVAGQLWVYAGGEGRLGYMVEKKLFNNAGSEITIPDETLTKIEIKLEALAYLE